MATNYASLADANLCNVGALLRKLQHLLSEQLYEDRVHFIYELIQNAEDAGSRQISFTLGHGELLIWNDGETFNSEHVRAICWIGNSTKDLTQVGRFGIGFKAVYTFTDLPEIHSGDESFYIEEIISPRKADISTPEIEKLIAEGKTVFRLPFAPRIGECDIHTLRERLQTLHPAALLFLNHLCCVEWRDRRSASVCEGTYLCHRKSVVTTDSGLTVRRLELLHQDALHELGAVHEWLVISRPLQVPAHIADELLERAEDEIHRHRVRQSLNHPQAIALAFRISDQRILPTPDYPLFAFLPAESLFTGLNFLLHGPYHTTTARSTITESVWNYWLLKETADCLPDVLSAIASLGYLTPNFFDLVPLENEVSLLPARFKPIAAALRSTLRSSPLIPTQTGGYAVASTLFCPAHPRLLNLISRADLIDLTSEPAADWTSEGLFDGASHRGKVAREIGVREVDTEQVLNWLGKKDGGWWADRVDTWLWDLYLYLAWAKVPRVKLDRLQLVRLHNGSHISPTEHRAFFQPSSDNERARIAPFLDDLPFLISLPVNDNTETVSLFLRFLGVRDPDPADIIEHWVLPSYNSSTPPSIEANFIHVRFMCSSYLEDREGIGKHVARWRDFPFLLCSNASRPETTKYFRPRAVYLSAAYTEDNTLECFFRGCSSAWFVDDSYLSNDSQDTVSFFEALGIHIVPRVERIQREGGLGQPNDWISFQQFFERHELRWPNGRPAWAKLQEYSIHGLRESLTELQTSPSMPLSVAIWVVLTRLIQRSSDLSPGLFDAELTTPTRRQTFKSIGIQELQRTAWLFDSKGTRRPPQGIFVKSDQFAALWGDAVPYLNDAYQAENQSASKLLDALGIGRAPSVDNVLARLRDLRNQHQSHPVIIDEVLPLYAYLASSTSPIGDRFRKESLILDAGEIPRWMKAEEAFWADEGSLFGTGFAYLSRHYASELRSFFLKAGVSDFATLQHYLKLAVKMAKGSTGRDERAIVEEVYRRIWELAASDHQARLGDLWRQLRDGRFWLAQTGSEWDFHFTREIVWNDDPYVTSLFSDKVPYFVSSLLGDTRLEAFATSLGIQRCSEATLEIRHDGASRDDPQATVDMRRVAGAIAQFLDSPRWRHEVQHRITAEELRMIRVVNCDRIVGRFRLKGQSAEGEARGESYYSSADRTVYIREAAQSWERPQLIAQALAQHFALPQLGWFVVRLLTSPPASLERVLEQAAQEFGLVFPSSVSTLPRAQVATEEESEIEPDSDGQNVKASDANTTADGSARGGNLRDGTASDQHPVYFVAPPEVPHPTPNERSTGVPIGSPTLPSTSSHRSVSRNVAQGGHIGYGSGEESPSTLALKKRLMDNPAILGLQNVTLLQNEGGEYRFTTGQKADLLFQDNEGILIAIEIEASIPPDETPSRVGMWQALEYKHLAAEEFGFRCNQVRAILAAPTIPNHIKMRCRSLGIEPMEIPV